MSDKDKLDAKRYRAMRSEDFMDKAGLDPYVLPSEDELDALVDRVIEFGWDAAHKHYEELIKETECRTSSK